MYLIIGRVLHSLAKVTSAPVIMSCAMARQSVDLTEKDYLEAWNTLVDHVGVQVRSTTTPACSAYCCGRTRMNV